MFQPFGVSATLVIQPHLTCCATRSIRQLLYKIAGAVLHQPLHRRLATPLMNSVQFISRSLSGGKLPPGAVIPAGMAPPVPAPTSKEKRAPLGVSPLLWVPTYLFLYPVMVTLTFLLYPVMFLMKPPIHSAPNEGLRSVEPSALRSPTPDPAPAPPPTLDTLLHTPLDFSPTTTLHVPADPIKSTAVMRYVYAPPKALLPKTIRKKTLVLDLDETLIHSLSRSSGGSGHASTPSTMIEVRLSLEASTLYHVFKRPHCDRFLREVSQWYELVVFTASVQEYADPVIDWLEYEQPYFSRRYYRRHCTLRPGVGYIKDLARVCADASGAGEDLGSVVIVDNSPVSYALHGDNGMLVEGWVNDNSDTELLSLVGLLRGLSLASDVRVILGLKNAFGATPEVSR